MVPIGIQQVKYETFNIGQGYGLVTTHVNFGIFHSRPCGDCPTELMKLRGQFSVITRYFQSHLQIPSRSLPLKKEF